MKRIKRCVIIICIIAILISTATAAAPQELEAPDGYILFRSNSMYSHASGEIVEIYSDGRSAAPYCTADGYMMIPLEFALNNCGAKSSNYVKYSDCCDFTIGTKNYSLYYGEHFILSGNYEYSGKYYCELRSDIVYVSASTFSRLTGMCYTFVQEPQGAAFIPYSGGIDPDYLNELVASLPDKRADATGYIALTFDDGPSGALTGRLLDGLKERNAHATFFLCDYRISSFGQVMDRYIAEGHEIANHSASHSALTSLSSSSLAKEIDETNSSIYQATGYSPTLLRPPGGAYNQTVLDSLKNRGISCILWSVDPLDWKLLNTEKVVNNIISCVSDGDIVLLHDLYSTSVDAALEVIDILSQQGYAFVTVSELAQIKGYNLDAGQVYYSFK